jgi:hypothetical protein
MPHSLMTSWTWSWRITRWRTPFGSKSGIFFNTNKAIRDVQLEAEFLWSPARWSLSLWILSSRQDTCRCHHRLRSTTSWLHARTPVGCRPQFLLPHIEDSLASASPIPHAASRGGLPEQVGPAYQKTHRPVSGPNRPSWRAIRPPEDLPNNSPHDLIYHNLKTRRTRQDLDGFHPKQIDGIWQDV